MVSAPPLVSWTYNHVPEAGSEEERLLQILKNPRDWALQGFLVQRQWSLNIKLTVSFGLCPPTRFSSIESIERQAVVVDFKLTVDLWPLSTEPIQRYKPIHSKQRLLIYLCSIQRLFPRFNQGVYLQNSKLVLISKCQTTVYRNILLVYGTLNEKSAIEGILKAQQNQEGDTDTVTVYLFLAKIRYRFSKMPNKDIP